MNNKTSLSQCKASSKYYHDNKEAVNERRREYSKEYSRAKYAEIKQDETKKQQRNEYYRRYYQLKKAALINSMLQSSREAATLQ